MASLWIIAGLLWFSPVVGLEYLPIGLLLIAQDVPFTAAGPRAPLLKLLDGVSRLLKWFQGALALNAVPRGNATDHKRDGNAQLGTAGDSAAAMVAGCAGGSGMVANAAAPMAKDAPLETRARNAAKREPALRRADPHRGHPRQREAAGAGDGTAQAEHAMGRWKYCRMGASS